MQIQQNDDEKDELKNIELGDLSIVFLQRAEADDI
jgi:hypothetical protein